MGKSLPSLTIDTGEVRLAINDDPNRVISFNPNDVVFAEKFYQFEQEFLEKEEEFRGKAEKRYTPTCVGKTLCHQNKSSILNVF